MARTFGRKMTSNAFQHGETSGSDKTRPAQGQYAKASRDATGHCMPRSGRRYDTNGGI